jgi:hypothetical protein
METMSRLTFYVRAKWDAEAKVWISESNILGLNIETTTLDEFEAVMNDVAAELVFENHIAKSDFSRRPLNVPTIIWERPLAQPAGA